MQCLESATPRECLSCAARKLGPLASGVMLCCALPPFDWTWLAWVALVPLAWSMAVTTRAQENEDLVFALAGGLIYAFGGMAIALATAGPFEVRSGYMLGWIISGCVVALTYVGVLVCGRVVRANTGWPMVCVLPIVWTAHEFVRQHAVALIDQTGFPFAKLSTTQADWTVLAQLADLGGAYLISLVVAMVSGMCCDVLWACFTRAKHNRWRTFVCSPLVATVVLIAAFAYGSWRIAQTELIAVGPSVVLMGEMDTPPLLSKDRLTSVDGHTPDLLVWPEHVYHHVPLERENSADEYNECDFPELLVRLAAGNYEAYQREVDTDLRSAARAVQSACLLGCQRVRSGSNRSDRFHSLAYISRAGALSFYDKQNLVPWAEFAPYGGVLFKPADCAKYSRGQSASVFELSTAGALPCCFGTAICFDVYFPAHFREMFRRDAHQTPSFLVHAAAEGLDRSGTLAKTSLRMAKLRAIECRRAIIRNVLGGDSGLIDSAGRLVVHPSSTSIQQPTPLGNVPIDSRSSLYMLAGDWLPLLLCVATVTIMCWRRSTLLQPARTSTGGGQVQVFGPRFR